MPNMTASQKPSLGVTPTKVADFFLAFAKETGESVTHLKLQKLVYYAQAWHLANFETAIFDSDFQAWVHGPVLYELYKELGGAYPGDVVTTKSTLEEAKKAIGNGELTDFLEEVCRAYMRFGGYELELMTHQEAPWKDARHGMGPREESSNVITKEAIERYYRSVKNGEKA